MTDAERLQRAFLAANERIAAATGQDPEGGVNARVSDSVARLAFSGLDVDTDELREMTVAAAGDYATALEPGFLHAVDAVARAEDPGEVLQAGYEYSRDLMSALMGAMTIGVLVGELHRQAEHDRERGNTR